MEFIRGLEQLNSNDVAIAGGKGASLGEMMAAGFPVPPGFVVLAGAFEVFQSRAGLDKEITAILGSPADRRETGALNEAANKLRDLVMAADIPIEIASAAREALSGLGADFVAVRSSATAEDGSTAAWAGQLDSFLNTTAAELAINIKKCWASLFSPRALAYRFDKGLATEEISMAVVVQKMVAADIAGVAFSAHPVTGDGGRVFIEAGPGLAEDLVAGRTTPDRYVIDKKTLLLIETTPASPEMTTPDKRGGPTAATLTLEKTRRLLAEEDILSLARLIVRIEDHFGFPVDVEWATDGQFSIVQSRPITTLPGQTAKPDQVWSNLNIAEVLPGVIPPLVKDIILGLVGPAIIKLLKLPPATELAADIKGRLYFNVTGLQTALVKITGAKDLDITALLGGEQGRSGALKQVPLAVKARLMSFGVAALVSSIFIQRKYDRFILEVRSTTADLLRRARETDDLRALLDLNDEALRHIEKLATDSLLMNAFPFSFYVIFSAAAKRWLGDNGAARGHSLLAAGGDGLQEIKALGELWAVRNRLKLNPEPAAGFLAARDVDEALASLQSDGLVWVAYQAFLDEHGHRCAKELDFSVPRWREDPAFIVSILKNYLKAADSSDPRRKRRELRTGQARVLASVKTELPKWKFRLLKKLLALAIDGQEKRENTKSEVVKLLLPLRETLLKIGGLLVGEGLLDDSRDIFMLRLEELRALADQAELVPDYFAPVLARKVAYEGYKALRLPPVITDIDNLDRDCGLNTLDTESLSPTDADALAGIAASCGRVEGIVCVIDSVDEIGRLNPGDILVTDHTDPGWTPVFATIKGLITNTGGLISHAAIVAREYGLPAVVNVPNATSLLKSGQRVLLDADNGLIRIVRD